VKKSKVPMDADIIVIESSAPSDCEIIEEKSSGAEKKQTRDIVFTLRCSAEDSESSSSSSLSERVLTLRVDTGQRLRRGSRRAKSERAQLNLWEQLVPLFMTQYSEDCAKFDASGRDSGTAQPVCLSGLMIADKHDKCIKRYEALTRREVALGSLSQFTATIEGSAAVGVAQKALEEKSVFTVRTVVKGCPTVLALALTAVASSTDVTVAALISRQKDTVALFKSTLTALSKPTDTGNLRAAIDCIAQYCDALSVRALPTGFPLPSAVPWAVSGVLARRSALHSEVRRDARSGGKLTLKLCATALHSAYDRARKVLLFVRTDIRGAFVMSLKNGADNEVIATLVYNADGSNTHKKDAKHLAHIHEKIDSSFTAALLRSCFHSLQSVILSTDKYGGFAFFVVCL